MQREQIEAIIYELDPAQLLAQGYPPEEYAPEIDEFTSLMAKGQRLTADQVYAAWEKWFGPGSETFIPTELHPVLAERLNQLLD